MSVTSEVLDREQLEEREMRRRFFLSKEKLSARLNALGRNDGTWHAGMESESSVVKRDYSLAPQHMRDFIVSKVGSDKASVELASSQLEIKSYPSQDVLSHGFGPLECQMTEAYHKANKIAHMYGARIVRTGCYAVADIKDVHVSSGIPKYETVPQWHRYRVNKERAVLTTRDGILTLDPLVVGLMNAMQVTVDAQSVADAIEKLNYACMVSPIIAAISVNAPFLSRHDTNYADVRMAAWMRSHDVRSNYEIQRNGPVRIGLPSRYYVDLDDYLDRISSHPFVLTGNQYYDSALEIANGLYWHDARLQFFFDKDAIAVEFRPIATQPSVKEDVAIVAFFMGLLWFYQENRVALTPMEVVRRNKESATRNGLRGYFLKPSGSDVEETRRIVEVALGQAERGLALMGISSDQIDGYLSLLYSRLDEGTPADQLRSKVYSLEEEYSCNRGGALVEAMLRLKHFV